MHPKRRARGMSDEIVDRSKSLVGVARPCHETSVSASTGGAIGIVLQAANGDFSKADNLGRGQDFNFGRAHQIKRAIHIKARLLKAAAPVLSGFGVVTELDHLVSSSLQ